MIVFSYRNARWKWRDGKLTQLEGKRDELARRFLETIIQHELSLIPPLETSADTSIEHILYQRLRERPSIIVERYEPEERYNPSRYIY